MPSPPVQEAVAPPAVAPAAAATEPPPNNDAVQAAEVRDSFTKSVTSTPEVEPIPVVTSPAIMPGVEGPR
jgi:hypothetical protein